LDRKKSSHFTIDKCKDFVILMYENNNTLKNIIVYGHTLLISFCTILQGISWCNFIYRVHKHIINEVVLVNFLYYFYQTIAQFCQHAYVTQSHPYHTHVFHRCKIFKIFQNFQGISRILFFFPEKFWTFPRKFFKFLVCIYRKCKIGHF